MRLIWLVGVTAILMSLATAPALAAGDDQESAEPPVVDEKLWKETGETGHGILEPVRGKSTPLEELSEIDADSLEAVRKRREEFRAAFPRAIPPLKYTVPVPKALAPGSPPTDFPASGKATGDFTLRKNTPASLVAPVGFSSIVNEPSVVAVHDTVFFTGNWYSALSTDGGDTFSYVNAFAGPFPKPGPTEDLCCDQVTTYEPDHDALFYIQQFFPTASRGIQRINVDLGADGAFDCFYDVTPAFMGMGANTWPDFPDVAVSDDHFFLSTNAYSTINGAFVGAYVLRLPLDLLGVCSGGVPFDVYRDFSGFFSFKLTRGATDRMYFADHISNAAMRIWRWREVDSAPVAFDRAVSPWVAASSANPASCPGPDNRDWCGRIDRRIAAAYVADGILGFMWTPAQGNGFVNPYTRVAQFSEPTFALVDEPIIWSQLFTWAYPSVDVNRNGDIGGTIMYGGPGLFTTCAAWIADDPIGDALAPLFFLPAYFGTTGPASNVSGDYNSTRTYYPNDFLYAGACFGYDSTSSGRAHYVLFGREGIENVFADGFESGDTASWSAELP